MSVCLHRPTSFPLRTHPAMFISNRSNFPSISACRPLYVRIERNGFSRGRAKSPSQIATPPANTESDEDEEPASTSNNGSATSLRSRPRSPWTTDESSDSEAHVVNTESSRLTSIWEKAAIQYPIAPESSLVCAEEEPTSRLEHSQFRRASERHRKSNIIPHSRSGTNWVHSMWHDSTCSGYFVSK